MPRTRPSPGPDGVGRLGAPLLLTVGRSRSRRTNSRMARSRYGPAPSSGRAKGRKTHERGSSWAATGRHARWMAISERDSAPHVCPRSLLANALESPEAFPVPPRRRRPRRPSGDQGPADGRAVPRMKRRARPHPLPLSERCQTMQTVRRCPRKTKIFLDQTYRQKSEGTR